MCGLLPNARHQARETAGARDERTLFAVACMPWFGSAEVQAQVVQTGCTMPGGRLGYGSGATRSNSGLCFVVEMRCANPLIQLV